MSEKTTTMTKAAFLAAVAAGTINEEIKTYAADRLAKLKDSSGNRKLTKKEQARRDETEAFRMSVFAILDADHTALMTAKEIHAKMQTTESVNRVSSALTELTKRGWTTATKVTIHQNKAKNITGGKVNGYKWAASPETDDDDGDDNAE